MTTAARLARLFPPDARPDGALLAAFLAARDEAAFAELVRRHGPLVLAACRRLLPDPADADDAFQASFLVLVRRARRLTGSAALGPWLYRVAAWTARNVRRRNARRLARSVPLADVPAAPASPVPALDLDAALLALPENYRAPLVLCHLQGWSRRDAAERLGCREGTLSSLLARGLVRLRGRLGGYDPAALGVGAAVPAALAAATVAGATATRAAVAPAVAELADGVLRLFWVPKATAAGLALVFALGAGVGLSVREAPATAQVPTAPAPREKEPPRSDQLERLVADLERSREQLTHHERDLATARRMLAPHRREEEDARAKLLALPADTPPDRRVDAEVEFERAWARAKSYEKDLTATLAQAEFTRTRVAETEAYLRLRGFTFPEVAATLAVEVTFPDTGRYRVGEAARGLVERATVAAGAAAADWDAAGRLPHVRVRFPAPHRTVRVAGEADIAVTEALVPLPLTRDPGGFVLVRDGARVVRLSGYPHAASVRFQEALAAAVPAAR